MTRAEEFEQQIRACLGQLFLKQAGRVDTGRDGHWCSPFESAVRGSLEGSPSGRRSRQERHAHRGSVHHSAGLHSVQSILAHAGQIDLLVNNVGYAQSGAIEENSIAEVQAQLDINLLGVLRMLKAVLPVMRRQGGGRVINVSSVQGRIAPPYLGVYATSKFALEGLSEALRDEVQPFGIYVSLIEPSFVKSNFMRQAPADLIADYTSGRQEALHFVSAGVARGVEPEAVAQVILRAATTPRPHLRYPVGRRAYLLMLLSRLLPEPAGERVRRRVFRPQAQRY